MAKFDRFRPVTPEDLRPVAPQLVTPEEGVCLELENMKRERIQAICERLKTRLLNNEASEGHALEKQPTETLVDYGQRLAQAIESLAEEVKIAEGLLSNDYAAVIQKHGAALDTDHLSEVFNRNFHQTIGEAVKFQVESVLETLKNEAERREAQEKHLESTKQAGLNQTLQPHIHEIGDVLKKTNANKEDTEKWIAAAKSICETLGEPHARETEKLDKIDYKNARAFMQIARVVGLASCVSSHVVAIASFSLTSFSNAAWICSGAMLGNIAINGTINYLRNKKLSDLQGRVSQNIVEATSMAGAVLWTGVMHRVMQELSDFFLFNRKNTQSLGNTALTTMEHTLKLIRDVPSLIYKDADKTGIDSRQFLQMDSRVNSGWAQVKGAVNVYLNRFTLLPSMIMSESIFAGVVAQLPLFVELTSGIPL